MPPEPRVGVVVPALDAERWLGAALESIVTQHGARLDVVVVDDGSTDGTVAVAEAAGPPVRLLRAPHGGIGAARNRGVAAVAGAELLAFLDADDLWPPGSLAARLRVLAERPEVDMVFGQVRHFAEMPEGRRVTLREPVAGHLPSAMLVRREAFDRAGPFATGVRVAEALDWLLRAREAGLGEVTVDDEVLWRRVHGANNSLRHRAALGEFTHALKASLDRRRATG